MALLPILSTRVGTVNRVSSFKLLGVYTVLVITHRQYGQKSYTKIIFFKQLKRAGLPSNNLFHYYSTVKLPVLEYCVPVWHYALTKAQIEQIEAIQKKAVHIVLNFSRGMPYMVMACRTWLCYLQQIYPLWSLVEMKCQGNSSLTFLNLLLACTTSSQTQEITRSFLGSGLNKKYPRVFTRTKRYCSFIQYALIRTVYQTLRTWMVYV